jgi:hypothetical protein
VDGDQILRLLAEREAAARVEWLRLEQEAAQIAGLIEQCRREIERLTVTREVLSGLVTANRRRVRFPLSDFIDLGQEARSYWCW